MKNNTLIIITTSLLLLGCARVKVGGAAEPIKVDMNVTMRVDVYQHVVKDLDNIDDIVYGTKPPQPVHNDNHSLLDIVIPDACAQETLSKEVEEAALRRRNRLAQLFALESKGIAGENKSGLVEIKAGEKADAAARDLVQNENTDRMTIYKAIARKNNTSVEQIQALYAKRAQEEAPAGTPIEIYNNSTQQSEWRIK